MLSTVVTLAIGTMFLAGCKENRKNNEINKLVEDSNKANKLVTTYDNKYYQGAWLVYITSEQIRRSHTSTETFQFPNYPKLIDINDVKTWLLFRISTNEINDEWWEGHRIDAGFLIPKPESQVDADWIIANGIFWNSHISLSGILYDFGNEAVVLTENCTQWIADDITWLDSYNDDLPNMAKEDWKQHTESFGSTPYFHPYVHIRKFRHLQESNAGYLTFGTSLKNSRYAYPHNVYSSGYLFRDADELRALLLSLTKDRQITLTVTIEAPMNQGEPADSQLWANYDNIPEWVAVAQDVWGPFSESDSSVGWLFK